MNFRQHNMAVLDDHNGISFALPSTAYSQVPPQKLLNVREFTILIDMVSDFSVSEGFGSILTYGLDYHKMNFIVGQWKDGIELRIQSDGTASTISFGKKHVFTKGKPTRFAIVYDQNRFDLYQNGKKIATRKTGPMTFSRWDNSYPLVVGSNAHGTGPWKGTIHSIAIFDRSLSKSKVQAETDSIRTLAPLIWYAFDGDNGTAVPDYGSGTPAPLIVPDRFIPYARTVLEFPLNRHNKFTNNILDITINLLGFIPLGFFLFMYMTHRHVSVAKALLLSIAAGFAVSLCIEISQGFLSGRSSSMLDLINNTLGSALGAFLYRYKRYFFRYSS
ncbi:MAG TPA: VanZ family protein [Syntrophales bacterium]|nr:VanZ family protein [Syntrophales bacterium]